MLNMFGQFKHLGGCKFGLQNRFSLTSKPFKGISEEALLSVSGKQGLRRTSKELMSLHPAFDKCHLHSTPPILCKKILDRQDPEKTHRAFVDKRQGYGSIVNLSPKRRESLQIGQSLRLISRS